MLIVSLWFSTRLNVKPRFWIFSQLIIAFLRSNRESGFSNLGFKTQLFNSQFLTQTDISFSRSNLRMAIFWFTLIGPVSGLSMWKFKYIWSFDVGAIHHLLKNWMHWKMSIKTWVWCLVFFFVKKRRTFWVRLDLEENKFWWLSTNFDFGQKPIFDFGQKLDKTTRNIFQFSICRKTWNWGDTFIVESWYLLCFSFVLVL